MTAGENISISEDNVISTTGGGEATLNEIRVSIPTVYTHFLADWSSEEYVLPYELLVTYKDEIGDNIIIYPDENNNYKIPAKTLIEVTANMPKDYSSVNLPSPLPGNEWELNKLPMVYDGYKYSDMILPIISSNIISIGGLAYFLVPIKLVDVDFRYSNYTIKVLFYNFADKEISFEAKEFSVGTSVKGIASGTKTPVTL